MKLKFYLRANFSRPSIDFKWTRRDNNKLFEYINKDFSSEYLLNPRNRLEMKQAFIDYFEPVGYILFRYKENQINLKVIPYTLQPKDSKHLKALIDLIVDNKDTIHCLKQKIK